MATYEELFAFIEPGLRIGPGCGKTLWLAKRFAEQHGLSFERLSRILTESGGRCDCEVLWRATKYIRGDEVIGEEAFETPIPHAIKMGFYCHCLVDGKPASRHDAGAAVWAGKAVNFCVPCIKDDPFAEPDLQRAIASLKAK